MRQSHFHGRLLAGVTVPLMLCACGGPQATAPDTPPEPAFVRPAPNPERNAYFGDLHIHTRNSFDAYIFNVRRDANDAYRFAKGEAVTHPSGLAMTISGGPLDFYTVTDHAEYLGILPAMDTPGTAVSAYPGAADMFSSDPAKISAAFQKVGTSVRTGEPISQLNDEPLINSVWQANIAAANAHYQPGKFTTFAAYEYTAVTSAAEGGGFGGGNLHRNVFFRGAAPGRAFSALDSVNPEDLWDWMDTERAAGREVISIPHNSNVSEGQMFRLETYAGTPMDAAYAAQRMRNEPLVEITQVKGTSETHPALSPNDEWADFEIYDKLLATTVVSPAPGSYVRDAYQRGLKLAETRKFDPFHFGVVGASDSHVVAGAYAENNYWSKIGLVDGTPVSRGSVPFPGSRDWASQPENQITTQAKNWFSRWGASGLTGVWAEENTREAIFDAFRRKETFATTGPRMKVRFFGGFQYTDDMLKSADLTRAAYAGGVPMGGDLVGTGAAPKFLAWAQRDPNGAALQRLQVVKITRSGEQVFDVACHTGAPDAKTHRCPDNGAGVDMTTCAPVGDGAAELKVLWRDPAFKAAERATYYVRVLENPTCRWSTWDALRAGTPPRPDVPGTVQDRAYTSPIWYIPG
jgi:Protein of unknown function (DUF3604)